MSSQLAKLCAVEPTTLLLARLPYFRECALQRVLPDDVTTMHGPGARTSLQGRSEGAFCTMRAKFIPKGLNRLIAEAAHMFVWHLNPCNSTEEIPPCLQKLHEAGCFQDETIVQPDYHG